MKKNLLLLCFSLAGMAAMGQSVVPNGDFENWSTASWDNPQNYPNTSNADEFFRYGLPFNVTKSTDAYHGTYAVQLTTNATAGDTVFAYFINTSPESNPETWTGGMAYDQKPTGLRGWYKYNVASADSGTIIIAFSKDGSNIGTYYVKLGGIKDTYTKFDIVFSPALSDTPDSVVLGALSCKFSKGMEQPYGPAGSTLVLDSISFTGVNAQPALLNGDFEEWDGHTADSPDSWYVQTDRGQGFAKSSDAEKGEFAIELTTFESNENNQAVARPGNASTGYYPDNCNENCQQLGGFPFTGLVDTLVFYYKFESQLPQATAGVNINLKKDGNGLWGQSVSLPSAANYTRQEVPISVNQAPDSMNIDIFSSQWEDTSLVYVGSKLLVDDIHLKSAEVATSVPGTHGKDSWRVYPNPTSGWIQITGLSVKVRGLDISDMSGKKVFSYQVGGLKPAPERIDLSRFGKGVYFITIDDGGLKRSEKVVVK